MLIREYRESDRHQLLLLSEDVWADKIAAIVFSLKKYTGDIEKCLIAEEDDCIVGFIYGYVLPSRLTIPEFLYVEHTARKKRIGRSLLEAFEAQSQCEASMIFYHKSLHDFYADLGYEHGENLEVAMKNIDTK